MCLPVLTTYLDFLCAQASVDHLWKKAEQSEPAIVYAVSSGVKDANIVFVVIEARVFVHFQPSLIFASKLIATTKCGTLPKMITNGRHSSIIKYWAGMEKAQNICFTDCTQI
jgi:hypothetical protein